MLNLLAKIYRNKIFIIIVILILITLPATFYMQSDKDKTIVTSAIGIDTSDDEYEVTILAVIPKGTNDINSNLEVFSASGKSISSALDSISLDLGKKIGLAHCDSIIFAEEIMNNNLSLILDYFIRTANLSTNPTLIATPDSAKSLLEAVKTSNNLLDLSLKNIIDSQEDRTLLDNVTIDRFYRAYLSPNSTFAIPSLSVKTSDEQSSGSTSGNMSDAAGESSGESGGSSGESNSSQKKITNNNEIAIIRDGKFVAKLTEEEKFIYNLLSTSSYYEKFELKNITDENVTNSTIIFQETDKIIMPKCTFKDGKPVMKYNVWLSVMLDEVISEDNHSYASINGVHSFITPLVEKKFNELIDNSLARTIELMHQNKYDVLNIYSKFNAFEYKKFKEYLNTLEHPLNYTEGITIEVDVKLNYVI